MKLKLFIVILFFHQNIFFSHVNVHSFSLVLRQLPLRIMTENRSQEYPIIGRRSGSRQKNGKNSQFQLQNPAEGTYHFGYDIGKEVFIFMEHEIGHNSDKLLQILFLWHHK